MQSYSGDFKSLARLLLSGFARMANCTLSLLPVDEHLILMEGSASYDDNARPLFERMIEKGLNKTYRIVWFMDRPEKFGFLEDIPNVSVEKYWQRGLSPCGCMTFMKLNNVAKYCFYCNKRLGLRTEPGQKRFDLMHGVSFKNTSGVYGQEKCADAVFTPSTFWHPIISKCYANAEGHLVATGYPRDDALVGERGEGLLSAFKSMTKIAWLPTFKRQMNNPKRNDFKVDLETDVALLTDEAMMVINEQLVESNAVLFVKFHPFQDLSFVNFTSLSNVVCLTQQDFENSNVFLYDFLNEFDALITDFSSVAYDWLITDRPIAFDLTDYDNYREGLGFSVDNVLDYMPGEKIDSPSSFASFIRNVAAGVDLYSDERRLLSAQCQPFTDGGSSERILDYVGL